MTSEEDEQHEQHEQDQIEIINRDSRDIETTFEIVPEEPPSSTPTTYLQEIQANYKIPKKSALNVNDARSEFAKQMDEKHITLSGQYEALLNSPTLSDKSKIDLLKLHFQYVSTPATIAEIDTGDTVTIPTFIGTREQLPTAANNTAAVLNAKARERLGIDEDDVN